MTSPDKCDSCGLCKENCPIFERIKKEIASPRSRLEYAKNNIPSPMALNCTFCNNCKKSCPYGIDISKEVRKLREHMVNAGMETKAGRAMIETIRKHGTPYPQENIVN